MRPLLKFHWIQVTAVIINHTNTTVIGNVIRTGRPATPTRASIQNIFRIPSWRHANGHISRKFSFPLRINPNVLENTLAIPMKASSTHNAPIISLYPFAWHHCLSFPVSGFYLEEMSCPAHSSTLFQSCSVLAGVVFLKNCGYRCLVQHFQSSLDLFRSGKGHKLD